MKKMRKIGPYLSVSQDFRTNMQTAIDTDTERGSAWLSEEAGARLMEVAPTVIRMAKLIEAERDNLLKVVAQLERRLLER